MPMQPWFPDAKLGIFVHWGIYAVDGIPESWSFYLGQVSYQDYLRQLGGFTAAAFDADSWARLFVRAGARYAVLTAKHHDGVALWDTGASDLSVVRRTPAGRDLVAEYAAALRRHDLKVGLYFSHLDWSHPDYATVRSIDPAHPHVLENRFSTPPAGAEDPERWARFLTFHRGQVHELVERFRPDLLWFDGEWERDERTWQMRELRDELRAAAPSMIINGRMQGYGDYATPEQGAPVTAPDGPWELCLTVNDSWGYQHADHNHKSVRALVRYFAETIGAGGNLLLDVGPREDGTILPEQASRLEDLGAWINRHRDAVYGTRAGLPPGHHYGPSTVSADRRTLYLTCFDPPREFVAVRGLAGQVRRACVVSTGVELAHRRIGGMDPVPGVLVIDAPSDVDPYATVIALELDRELEVYRGRGRD